MSFLNSLSITGSALTAERLRIDVALQNISNAQTTRTSETDENGNPVPYARQQVVFEERGIDFSQMLNAKRRETRGGGVRVVQVVENERDFIPVYDPDHPDANEEGYVMYPNVNTTEERIDLMAASTAYQANLTALGIVKSLALKSLEIGK